MAPPGQPRRSPSARDVSVHQSLPATALQAALAGEYWRVQRRQLAVRPRKPLGGRTVGEVSGMLRL